MLRELRGNLHVHSDQSDGTLPIQDIAKVAAGCKLDFIGINDHHVICGQNQYLHGVLVLMGTEFNSRHSHYLAYNSDASFPTKQVNGAKIIRAVQRSGGMGIIAHPFEKGSPIVSKGKHYPWRNWDVQGFDGIELWNQTSQWRDAARGYLQALKLWLFNRYRPFYQGACPHALAKWDRLCQSHHVSGLAGSDLHAPVLRALGFKFKILDYPMLFSAVNNYVLADTGSGDAVKDSVNLLRAMARGNCWFALDRLSLAYGFSFTASSGDEQAGMGSALQRREKTWLQIKSPRRGKIVLIRNGIPVAAVDDSNFLEFAVRETGVYRVEVKLRQGLRWLPWLYSNPVYLH